MDNLFFWLTNDWSKKVTTTIRLDILGFYLISYPVQHLGEPRGVTTYGGWIYVLPDLDTL